MDNNRLNRVLIAIDCANKNDPNQVEFEGQLQAKEVIYSQHMTRWLFILEPDPSELMQVACRAQHLERWMIPRNTYPEGRAAYYDWRKACNQMHGQRAAEIMAECGYNDIDCQHVAMVISKRELRYDKDTQLLEDVACLVFLERYFIEFHEQKIGFNEEQWGRIIKRTWDKMSEKAKEEGFKLVNKLPEYLQLLFAKVI